MINLQPPGQCLFENRKDAGRILAKSLMSFEGDDVIILALPRGGVSVAYECVKLLDMPMEVVVARKIGAPFNPELGIGAISEGNTVVLDKDTIKTFNITQEELNLIIEKEKKELQRRIKLYRDDNPLPDLHYKTVILIDDGLATGITAEAAIKAILKLQPLKLIFAAPVCAVQNKGKIRSEVDEVICLYSPSDLNSIGQYYRDFTQTTDEDVIKIMGKIHKKYPPTSLR